MSSIIRWSSALALLLIAATVRAEDESDDAYPLPTRLSAQGDFQAYSERAQDYLEQHPDSPHAPRVAFDLLMAGTAARNPGVVKQATALLLLNYSTSLPAVYLVSTYKDAGAYGNLLSGLFDERVDQPDPAFTVGFTHAVRLGLQQFGTGLLGGEILALKAGLAAREAGDRALEILARSFLREAKPETQQLAAIAFETRLDAAAKIEALHAQRGDATAALLERFLMVRLSDDERQAPAIKRIRAERAIQKGRFQESLEILDTFAAADLDPQLLFWLGWSLAARGNHEAAVIAIDQLQERFPESPWNRPARELAACLPTANESIENCAALLLPELLAMKKLQSTDFEIQLTYARGAARPPLDCYLAASFDRNAENQVTVMIREAGRTLLAYRSRGRLTSVYFAEEPAIHHFQQALIPVPKLEIREEPDGSFQFTANARLESGLNPLPQNGPRIFDSEFLSTHDGLVALLRSLIRMGWFPAAPQVEGRDTQLSWLILKTDVPEVERAEFHISGGKLTSFKAGPIQCTGLRYGQFGAMRSPGFEAPAWPDKPVVTARQMDPAIFFRLMGALSSLVTAQPGPAQAEQKPDAERR
jgi:tetratricopeptide (TPR) repeat protein